jgi:EAL domain-containing protein (putative c-di-GMP-specific phosphodiesterase class I)
MALAEDRFEIHTQPIYPLRAGGVVGYELLVRLRERGALIGPEVFIPTAERLGLVEEIDRHVLAQAIDLLAGDRDGHVAYHVNVSALSIANPQLLRFVATETAAAAADPARLTIEVAETAAFIDLDAVQHFALGLERLGCKLALDDFGSGFGSFAYLKFVPVSALKIDGGLIAGMAGSDDDRLIVKAIVDIAHGKGIETIAEQVGTEDTRQLLIDLGADYGQGDLYGEPSALGLSVGRSSAQGSG